MLKECKLALRVTAAQYEPELCRLMEAGAKDLEIAGVVLPGTVAFAETNDGIRDDSDLTDALCITAILTYVRAHFGSPDDYERLQASYELQKGQLMHATGYTNYGGEDDGEG